MSNNNKKIPKPKVNKVGLKYGHWIVLEQDLEKTQQTGKIYWKCICDCGCGTTKSIRTDALLQVTVGGCDNVLGTHQNECLKCHKKFFTKKQAEQRQFCYDCLPEGLLVRNVLKKWAVEYKGGKCQICGYNRCMDALDFHHLDPTKKQFNIANFRNITVKWTQIKQELDKCLMICSNCHREVHAGLYPEYLKEGD